MIAFENEVVKFLGLPSIPKKEWDGKSDFEKGVAVLTLTSGQEAYAVCSFDNEKGRSKPSITKVFGQEPFIEIKNIYVVPSYMVTEDDVDDMDLDDESKQQAKMILEEAKDAQDDGQDVQDAVDKLPEWIFPEITNKDEAQAWLRQYNKKNKIKGKIPSNEETLKLRLLSIHSQLTTK